MLYVLEYDYLSCDCLLVSP